MITATSWVPPGRAAQFPVPFEVSEQDALEIERLAGLKLDDARKKAAQATGEASDDDSDVDLENGSQETGASSISDAAATATAAAAALKANSPTKTKASSQSTTTKTAGEDADFIREFDLENYDNDSDNDGEKDVEEENGVLGLFGAARSLAYHASNDEDPYITLKDVDAAAEDDEEDRAALEIMPSDRLVLATSASLDDGVAELQVYVYEDGGETGPNLFLHHDVPLADVPLAVEWFGFAPGQAAEGNPGGSFAAVGTMGSDIEIWNLDVPDAVWPAAILGQSDPRDLTISALSAGSSTKKSKSKSKKTKVDPDTCHTGAVLSLAANRAHLNLLASGSADTTIKLWDLATTTCAQSYKNTHAGHVASLAWHPTETALLLSGGCAPSPAVVLTDMRAPTASPLQWSLPADAEVVRWDAPPNSHRFLAATDAGEVLAFDVRAGTGSPPIWRLHAHDGKLTSLDISPVFGGCFVTASSSEKTVKVWTAGDESASGPRLVLSRDVGVGSLFSATFAPGDDRALRLAIGGSAGSQALRVWDLASNRAVRAAFPGSVPSSRSGDEVLVGVAADGADDDEDEDDDDDDMA